MSLASRVTGRYFTDPEWESDFESLAFTAEALIAHPDPDDAELGRLSRRATAVLADWEEIDMAGRGARRAALNAAARVRAADVALDQSLTEFARDLLAHVHGDRNHELYTRLFPEPHEDVIELGVDAELPSATLLLMALDADPSLPAHLKSHHGALRVAVQLGTRALAERADTLADIGRHHARVEAWRDGAAAMMRNLHRWINNVGEARNMPPRWASAFFLVPPTA